MAPHYPNHLICSYCSGLSIKIVGDRVNKFYQTTPYNFNGTFLNMQCSAWLQIYNTFVFQKTDDIVDKDKAETCETNTNVSVSILFGNYSFLSC